MALRCLLFTSETGTAEPICQALSALGVEGEHCPEAVGAIDKVTQQPFQLVIIDWDHQPEASMVLAAARERKASERPLTLAIVGEDINVPKALQAGANSILRRPIVVNQVKDTLTTARDLLKAKESAALAAAAGVSVPSSSMPHNLPPSISGDDENKKNLRAGEFLPSSGARPSGEFLVEETNAPDFAEAAPDVIDPLKELEPTAASVAQARPTQLRPTQVKPMAPRLPQPVAQSLPPASPPEPGDEPRGLDWYMKRAGLNRSAAAAAPAPAREASPAAPSASSAPELLGFEQTPFRSASDGSIGEGAAWNPDQTSVRQTTAREAQTEHRLFSYIDGESSESEAESKPRFRLGKGTIVVASLLAVGAIIAAPQAPWHSKVSAAWAQGRRSLHAWLNPQVVTNTAQAPESHESFARAGDEYKLPVAETIPDATTDPSQIKVVPVIDPTAKKPGNAAAGPEQNAPTDNASPANDVPVQGSGTQAPTDQSVGTAPDGTQPTSGSSAASPPTATQPGTTQTAPVQAPFQSTSQPASQPTSKPTSQPVPTTSPATAPPTNSVPTATSPTPSQPHSNAAGVPSSLLSPRPADPAGPTVQVPQGGPNATVTGPSNVPSSLKSQIASMTPEASGNKPAEAAMPSIEPVAVSEAVERQLLTEQPAIAYPASAKSQQGKVMLQVLIGRDGTVQDAKFLQGSLAFARAAIDGVKLWKFKPYTMNGHPVAVQTTLTIGFKPAN